MPLGRPTRPNGSGVTARQRNYAKPSARPPVWATGVAARRRLDFTHLGSAGKFHDRGRARLFRKTRIAQRMCPRNQSWSKMHESPALSRGGRASSGPNGQRRVLGAKSTGNRLSKQSQNSRSYEPPQRTQRDTPAYNNNPGYSQPRARDNHLPYACLLRKPRRTYSEPSRSSSRSSRSYSAPSVAYSGACWWRFLAAAVAWWWWW